MKDLEEIIACLPGHVYWKNREGVYLGCNQAQAKSFGATIENIRGKTDADFQNKKDAEIVRRNDIRIIKTGKAELVEERARVGNTDVLMLSHKAPLRNKEGEIIGIIGQSIDISEQINAKVKLLAENHIKQITIDHLIQSVPGHIYFKDKNGCIVFCNNEQASYFGYEDAKGLIGKFDSDLYDKETAEAIRLNDLRIMQDGKTQIVEESIGINNEYKIVISHKSPLKDPDTNEIVGILGISVDITHQKKLEEALSSKNMELLQALEVKRHFLDNMSHEITTPLTSLLTMTETMEHYWDNISEDKKRLYLKDILNGRDRLMNLLSNLLDLSKFQQGKVAFEFKSHDIKHLIMEVVEEFKDMTHPIDLEVLSDVETDICCDGWRIKQVIRHIMANAIKHGGKDKPIMIRIDKIKNVLQVTISDEGVGVPDEEKQSIFEPFNESKRTQRSSGGTGMGLTICQDIIKGHKGEIWVENNKPVGSIFKFSIPYEKRAPKVYSFRLTQRS